MCDRLSNAFVKASLFSSVVATFLALSIPDLQDQNSSHTHSLVVNILWLISLVLSVGSALFASKIQELVETYRITEMHQATGVQTTEAHQMTTGRSSPSQETLPPFVEYTLAVIGYISTLLVVLVLEIICRSLEIAVFSFFAGLIIYVWNIHTVAGHIVLAFVCFFFCCYWYSPVFSEIHIQYIKAS